MSEPVKYEDLPDFMDIKELKLYLRIGFGTAYKLARRKDFPKVRLGNKLVFSKALVKEWYEEQIKAGRLPRKLRAM